MNFIDIMSKLLSKNRREDNGIRFSIAFFIFLFLIPTVKVFGQEESEYDEISVFFSVPRIGGAEVSALLKDEKPYLSVIEVFNFLRIKNSSTSGFDKVSGFLINQEDSYEIDRVNNKITYLKKMYELKPGDLVRTETNLYLKSNYFGEIFGLECTFSFRSLTVSLNTKIELPVIREMRQEQMRKSIGQIKGDVEVDTVLKRKFPFFNFGTVDWTAVSLQSPGTITNTRLSTNIGAVVAGGEADIQLNYTSGSPFLLKNQYYQWRYANNNLHAFKQITLGKISSGSISTLSSSVIGGQITNTPTTYRRSFGTYTLSDVTEPGWLVELYVNNVLVDYKKADASGFFTFEVPLIYGSTDVKLQYYGPWGEERSKEKKIEIPFNFLPAGKFEYNISGGMVDDSLNRIYSKANFDFGISRFLTVGGGVEYLTPLDSAANYIPFAKASLKLSPTMLLSGEYNYGVDFNTIFNWRFKSDLQLELNYKKYDKGQSAITTSYLEERKLSVSMPVRFPKFSFYTRLSLNQYILSTTEYTTAEFLFSGSLFGVNTNLTTNAQYSGSGDPTIYSSLSLSLRLPGEIILTPQTQYNYSEGNFTTARCGLEKKLFKKGYLTLSYERNVKDKTNNIEMGFRYDFSFAQAGITAQRNAKKTTFTESASGSIVLDVRSKYLGTSSRTSVGTGGLIIYPFMDVNCNGKRDKGEPKAYGLQVHINGGRIEQNDKDTTVRVFELESYADHVITLDGSAFDNIAWQMKNKNIKVTVEPNMFRRIEVPVSVFGEASGTVYMANKKGTNGQGRILINIYRSNKSLVKSTMSEADGYFSYLGLPPGNYIAGIDPVQMSKLDMVATPDIPFTVKPNIDGDMIDNLEFTIRKNKEDETVEEPVDTVQKPPVIIINQDIATDKQVVVKDKATVDQLKSGLAKTVASTVTSTKDTTTPVKKSVSNMVGYNSDETIYKVQLAALRKQADLNVAFRTLLAELPYLKINESLENDGLYHYTTNAFKSMAEAERIMEMIKDYGWKECVINTYLGAQRAEKKIIAGETVYRVQLMAMSKSLDIKAYFAGLQSKINGLEIEESLEDDGLYHYSAGTFRNKAEALKLIKVIKESGWKDCFIVTYLATKQ